MAKGQIEKVLARRLPTVPEEERKRLAAAYLTGVQDHAAARTTGAGPVPTTRDGACRAARMREPVDGAPVD